MVSQVALEFMTTTLVHLAKRTHGVVGKGVGVKGVGVKGLETVDQEGEDTRAMQSTENSHADGEGERADEEPLERHLELIYSMLRITGQVQHPPTPLPKHGQLTKRLGRRKLLSRDSCRHVFIFNCAL